MKAQTKHTLQPVLLTKKTLCVTLRSKKCVKWCTLLKIFAKTFFFLYLLYTVHKLAVFFTSFVGTLLRLLPPTVPSGIAHSQRKDVYCTTRLLTCSCASQGTFKACVELYYKLNFKFCIMCFFSILLIPTGNIFQKVMSSIILDCPQFMYT